MNARKESFESIFAKLYFGPFQSVCRKKRKYHKFFYSHERKKKYWEQLELRCRHLYRRQQHQPSSQSSHFGNHPSSILLTPGSAQCGYCVEDPRYYNTNPEVYPQGLYSEYWNQAQRSNGNIYSPNPEENVTQNEAETQDTR